MARIFAADMSPWEFAPTAQHQLEWPKWGQFNETNGTAGERPDIPEAVRLKELFQSWLAAADADEHARIWHEMLEIWATQTFTIGIIAGVQQPIVVNAKLRNVPASGMYNWDPGAQFGMFKPDGFWFDNTAVPAASAALSPRER